jgi:hypothetical protein
MPTHTCRRSGQASVRFRLSRSLLGSRWSTHTCGGNDGTALVMGCHQPTKDYVARRTAEGKTKTKIMRCLKRYIAREVFPHLLHAAPAATCG